MGIWWRALGDVARLRRNAADWTFTAVSTPRLRRTSVGRPRRRLGGARTVAGVAPGRYAHAAFAAVLVGTGSGRPWREPVVRSLGLTIYCSLVYPFDGSVPTITFPSWPMPRPPPPPPPPHYHHPPTPTALHEYPHATAHITPAACHACDMCGSVAVTGRSSPAVCSHMCNALRCCARTPRLACNTPAAAWCATFPCCRAPLLRSALLPIRYLPTGGHMPRPYLRNTSDTHRSVPQRRILTRRTVGWTLPAGSFAYGCHRNRTCLFPSTVLCQLPPITTLVVCY